MATVRKGNFEIIDLTELVELAPRTPKMLSSLGLVEDVVYGKTTWAEVERVEEFTDTIKAQERGGDRNFAGRENAIVRNFKIPFFPLDDKIKASDVQDLREYVETDASKSLQGRVDRSMKRIKRSHDTHKEKALYAAIKGTSYTNNGGQVYDYATEFGVSGDVITADIDFSTVTLPSAEIETARAHIIDNAKDNGDAYQIIAICGRDWFNRFVESDEITDAYNGYPSQQEPLRKRLGGDLINRSFEHKGVTYIEDISGYIDSTDAYIMPLGISDMFQMQYAPADTKAAANQTAEEMYVFLLSDDHRLETLETETSFLICNTRPELVVRSVGTFA